MALAVLAGIAAGLWLMAEPGRDRGGKLGDPGGRGIDDRRAHLVGDIGLCTGSYQRSCVIDGDSIRHRGETVRLVGFDTPETGRQARCRREEELGQRATHRLRELVATARAAELETVPCACRPGTHGTNACNFGRACGTLRVDGREVGDILIGEGLARRYVCGATGCPPRRSWC